MYINADDIKRAENLSDIEAAEKAQMLREQCVEARVSFSFETVLSTERHIELLTKAKEYGFFIKLYYILTCNPLLNVERVKFRVNCQGHDVPADKIIERYNRGRFLIPIVYHLADRVRVYDNSEEYPLLIARKHRLGNYICSTENWSFDEVEKLIGDDGVHIELPDDYICTVLDSKEVSIQLRELMVTNLEKASTKLLWLHSSLPKCIRDNYDINTKEGRIQILAEYGNLIEYYQG